MTGENKAEIELKPAEESPWYRFYLATRKFDKEHELFPGFSWFFGFYYLNEEYNKLSNFSFLKVKEELSAEHWLNQMDDDKLKTINEGIKDYLPFLLQNLLNELGNPHTINRIDFSKLLFNENVNFSNFIFPIDASFAGSKFAKGAQFGMASFHNETIFYSTKFHGKVLFILANFSGAVEFGGAVFSNDVQFVKASFGVASFRKTSFSELADFANTSFSDMAGFRGAKFSGAVRFNSANLDVGVSFSDAIFQTNAPEFYNAKISEDITWDRAKFPSIKNRANRDLIQRNKEAYENLSGRMAKMSKHDYQHLFFREEMRCRRWLGSRFNHLIHGLYAWFADYGYGVGHALCWWAGHIALGVLVIAFISMWGGVQFNKSLPCAISVSFANANPYALFGFDSVNLKECYKGLNILAPTLFAIVKAIQTILGVGLLFLVLLTLRIRFRLK